MNVDFASIRSEGGDRREGFEEFSAQLFRRYPVPLNSRHERFRGAGGDGGVKAVWHLPAGEVVGLQSKFFLPLRDAHLRQLEKSLDVALSNYPTMTKYVVTLPFDPTPTIAARPGRKGQNEKLEAWRVGLEARATALGASVSVEWWCASELKSRLLAMDNADGRLLYWFGAVRLTPAKLDALTGVAERIAGGRYSPELRVGTGAGDVLGAFSLDPSWLKGHDELAARTREAVRDWKCRPIGGWLAEVDVFLGAFANVMGCFEHMLAKTFDEAGRLAMMKSTADALALARVLEVSMKAEFDAKHGAENDTAGWRQFQASYQVAFPAVELDQSREVVKLLQDLVAFAGSDGVKASAATILLMQGAAGIGKTHTTIDAVKGQVVRGRGAIAILGQEITASDDPWSVVAKKLDMSSAATRSEIVGVLSSYAEKYDAPLLLMIDAINETPDRSRWQNWLPSIKADLAGQPIRLLLTSRDIYLEETLGPSLDTIPSFTHDGFSGREYEAAHAFASFYKVGPPAEVVAQPEFGNPLFLHLVCRAAVNRNWSTIPGGQVSLTMLIDAILDGANAEAAKVLDYDVRLENPVKAGALALARAMGRRNVRSLDLAAANKVLDAVRPSPNASNSLLRALEAADLVATGREDGVHTLRFGFERLGDLLIAESSIEGEDGGTIRNRFLAGDLAALTADEHAIAANAGLLQAYSIVLPERFGFELVHLAAGSPHLGKLTELALDVLAWRDAGALSETRWVLGDGRFGELIVAMNKVLLVAAMPGHPLNINWVDKELSRYPKLTRDAVWSETLTRSWYADGPVRRLVSIARNHGLKQLSLESAQLLGRALALFTSCADRRVRDEATMALANLLDQQAIAEDLVDRFLGGEDDPVGERVLLAVYGAGLRKRDPRYWNSISGRVYRDVFGDGGAVTVNVTLRDLGRLVLEEALDAGTLPGNVDIAHARPPYSSAWPLALSFGSWNALATACSYFPDNLLLGAENRPDFAIYCVNTAADDFDLGAAGSSTAQVNQWIVEQIVDLGYDDPTGFALGYDMRLIAEIGDGRGADGGRERISKKYQWVFLAHLLGRLNDNVGRRSRSWSPTRGPLALQGIGLRTIDPTDVSDPARDGATGRRPNADLLPPTVINFGENHTGWAIQIRDGNVPLLEGEDVLLSASLRTEQTFGAPELRNVQNLDFRSYLVPTAKMAEVRGVDEMSFPNGDVPDLYRLLAAEYPRSAAYRNDRDHWQIGSNDWGTPTSVVIRGNDRAYTRTRDLWAPEASLQIAADIYHDGGSTWKKPDQEVVAIQVHDDAGTVLRFSKASMRSVLERGKFVLVWISYYRRMVIDGNRSVASADLKRVWEWDGKKAKLVAEFPSS